MNTDDIVGPLAGFGIIAMIFGIILYLGVMALTLWVFYLIIRTAVKNGILKADEERAARSGLAAQRASADQYRGPHPGPQPGAPTGYGRPVP